jgi:hypothetical protein
VLFCYDFVRLCSGIAVLYPAVRDLGVCHLMTFRRRARSGADAGRGARVTILGGRRRGRCVVHQADLVVKVAVLGRGYAARRPMVFDTGHG